MLERFKHIHILGGSGSGTTTLGRHLSEDFGHFHLDTDDYFWEKTDPPFTTIRPVPERLVQLRHKFQSHEKWILSGSLVGWGDVLIPEFDLVIFVTLPGPVRMQRLKAREIQRYGEEALLPGGHAHEAHEKFMIWASQYDTADETMRSLRLHRQWLTRFTVPVVHLEGEMTYQEQLQEIEKQLSRR
ncbi:AAA family ATPase [Deinococcus cellulosilyticus]|uniref:Adenylate kinase n=1 Tax=Deinococcus cellulosilyticus (strain DSM 18568 / NBRC 106333 / KACC 11606 / 5516J-15) TaxID=1223518 RepID=A0A511N6X2_DEIC1|nr:hypothetical protein [Deinococcus cellulosilyticus]GEM48206.1 adenylate kinase [Deinococcus cellulosilyticus NBRC 106333 = KACC 11606]